MVHTDGSRGGMLFVTSYNFLSTSRMGRLMSVLLADKSLTPHLMACLAVTEITWEGLSCSGVFAFRLV